MAVFSGRAAAVLGGAAGPAEIDAAFAAVLHAGFGAGDLDELAGFEGWGGVAGGEDGGGQEAGGEELVHHGGG